jgi:Xaa-Pro aminopeptidase
VGLCDEWSLTAYPDQLVDGAFKYELEAGMVICVEALVSPEADNFSIKLEDQILITEDGFKNLATYEFDTVLMGW